MEVFKKIRTKLFIVVVGSAMLLGCQGEEILPSSNDVNLCTSCPPPSGGPSCHDCK